MPTWKKQTILFWKSAKEGSGKASGLCAAEDPVHICILKGLYMFVSLVHYLVEYLYEFSMYFQNIVSEESIYSYLNIFKNKTKLLGIPRNKSSGFINRNI